MTRSSIIRGPALITYRGATFWSQGDIDLNFNIETFSVETSALGKVDERDKDVLPQISFTPVGEWESLEVLYPYFSNQDGAILTIGAEIFTAADGTAGDSPLVIHTLAGTTYTFHAAAVTKMPDITLASTKTLLGQVQFTCVRKDNTAWSADNSLVTINAAAGAPASDTEFDPSAIITQPYTCAWQSPLDSFSTSTGVVVAFDTRFDPTEVDGTGTQGMTLADVGVMARCIPVGVTEANMISALGIQGSGATRGRSRNATSHDFTIAPVSGSSPTVVVKNAALKQAGFKFGNTTLRGGEFGFLATRSFPSGVNGPLFTLA
jgi:hypothetical protein